MADLTIGFRMFRETFRSRVGLNKPGHIHVIYENGPFRYLNNHWRFTPVAGGTEVDFFVDFEFRSRILQVAIGVVFNEAVRLMVRAFMAGLKPTNGPARRASSAVCTPATATACRVVSITSYT